MPTDVLIQRSTMQPDLVRVLIVGTSRDDVQREIFELGDKYSFAEFSIPRPIGFLSNSGDNKEWVAIGNAKGPQ